MNNQHRAYPISDESLAWTNPSTAVLSGAVVAAGGRFGVCVKDTAASGTESVAMKGEFRLTKGTGYTFTQGQRVTWDGTKVVAWTPASATPCMGRASLAALTGDTVCYVILGDGAPRVHAFSRAITAGEAAANSGNGQIDVVTGFGAIPTYYSATVRATTTGRIKTTYDVLLHATAGTVSVKGVAAGTQLDEGDFIDFIAIE